MGAANAHYYATRDPLGASGDFTTAPEISQMFGELAGAWLGDLWDRAGRSDARYVELGPGRGTLAADALRVLARAGCAPEPHLVETSPVLRGLQAERVTGAAWHDRIEDVPQGKPLLIVANEFFDALPIRQLVRTQTGWRERLVACQDTLFLPIPGREVHDRAVPPQLRDAPIGSILETSPDGVGAMRALAQRLVADGGAALIVDYGYEGPALGDTLQAVSRHGYANPFEEPGTRDLTAHVDFATLAAAALAEGAAASEVVTQGSWLMAMGIEARAEALIRGNPARAEEIAAARDRLARPEAMGELFRVLAVTAPGWPAPTGFA
ncbi:class I SAM-dependent methyltransferase [Sphingomonas gilva]|uniref:Class I SAM-dependent methyltransferase n=2 Tax=Sphingomonas gilva TaxID=2305907 RepID=A0A396RTR6_9SPHN|nr:class I SAM-dependent methyltransferase [Sphingomonas gilva]